MLLNVSNHPADTWATNQIRAAEAAYARVQDYAFPAIDPALETGAVRRLAEQHAQRIRSLLSGQLEASAVHIMGELTFTLTLVRLLQEQGIQCVVSTSERHSRPNSDGSKTIVFQFVRFRTYPVL